MKGQAASLHLKMRKLQKLTAIIYCYHPHHKLMYQLIKQDNASCHLGVSMYYR